MKRYKYKILKEQELQGTNSLYNETDLNELIGFLKSRWKTISQVKNCPRFKALSFADKEYILDELKSEGWR